MLRGGNPDTWHGWIHGIAFLLIIATCVLAPVTMALAVAFLGEALSLKTGVGVVLIICGAIMATIGVLLRNAEAAAEAGRSRLSEPRSPAFSPSRKARTGCRSRCCA